MRNATAADRADPSKRKHVCIISALWGRTGSTTIFDSQTRFFQSRGYSVCRLFIEHWEKPQVRGRLLLENFELVQPDSCVIVSRRDGASASMAKSSVGRLIDLLSAAEPLNEAAFLAMVRRTDLVVANHTMHVGFAAKWFKVPIILELHDRLTQMLDGHGVPDFAVNGPDKLRHRMADEIEAIAKATHCVALSKSDYEYFKSHHASVSYIRPVPGLRGGTDREPHMVLKDNGVSNGNHIRFDLLLWGDWHSANVHSCIKFFEKTSPHIKKKVSIGIAGRLCEMLPKSIRSRSNVTLLGQVDNLADVFALSKVLVLYDDKSSGISIKTIDALASGRPFAATEASMRDLALPRGYFPSTSFRKLADDINVLLDNSKARELRSTVARNIAHRNFSEARYQKSWESLLAKIDYSKGTLNIISAKPTFSVIICTFNRYDQLPAAIDSVLKQQAEDVGFEVIVVDNYADPQEYLALCERYREERLVRIVAELKCGLSHARNAGVAAAAGEFCCFIDDDAEAKPGWLAEVAKAFKHFGTDAAVVGGAVEPLWLSPPPDWISRKHMGYLSVVDWGGDLRCAADHEWFAGCNIAFKKSALIAAGGFNVSLGRNGNALTLLSNEETDACERITELGGYRVYAPRAQVIHKIDPSRLSKNWFKRRIAWQAVSDYLVNPERSSKYGNEISEQLRNLLCAELKRSNRSGILERLLSPLRKEVVQQESISSDVNRVYDYVMTLLSGEDLLPGP